MSATTMTVTSITIIATITGITINCYYYYVTGVDETL